MKKNVLVFPACSEVGLEINRSITNSEHFNIIGGSSEDYNNAEFAYLFNFNNLPKVTDANFIDELNFFIEEHHVDYIYPAHDLVVLKLAENIDKLNCDAITSEYTTVDTCIDKYKCYMKFKNIINIPEIYNNLEEVIKFPVFLKPKIGHGSIGTQIVNNKDELFFYTSRNSDLICMEYLPGKEYTVDCFTDKNGHLKFSGARERKSIFAGMSSRSVIIINSKIDKIAALINGNLNLRGAWFFQLKERENGDLVLLEIGPRIAGGMDLYRNKGINLPLLSLYDRLDHDIEVIENSYDIEMGRNLESRFKADIDYNKVYIDLDGTLLIDNKINIQLISFIYQCINRNIEVYLVTLHNGDLNKLIETFRIKNLFNGVIWLREGTEKFNFIDCEKSIFIDNSFNHRLKVYNNKNIPVFDVNSIDCLIDPRRY